MYRTLCINWVAILSVYCDVLELLEPESPLLLTSELVVLSLMDSVVLIIVLCVAWRRRCCRVWYRRQGIYIYIYIMIQQKCQRLSQDFKAVVLQIYQVPMESILGKNAQCALFMVLYGLEEWQYNGEASEAPTIEPRLWFFFNISCVLEQCNYI